MSAVDDLVERFREKSNQDDQYIAELEWFIKNEVERLRVKSTQDDEYISILKTRIEALEFKCGERPKPLRERQISSAAPSSSLLPPPTFT
jgi:hypothetical protein